MRSGESRGIAVVVSAAFFYAAATVMARLAYARGADPLTLVAVRFALGAVVLWTLAVALRRPRFVPRHSRGTLVWMGAVSVVVGVLFFGAVERLGAGTATLALYAHPAMVAAGASVLGWERFGAWKSAALAGGVAGVALVVGTPRGDIDPAGVLLGLGAAVALAAYVLLARRGGRDVDPVVSGAVILTVSATLYLAVAVPAGILELGLSSRAWGWLVGGAASSGAAFALFLAAVGRLGPTRASLGASAEPVLAVLLAAIFLGERLTALQAAGAGLIVAVVALLPLIERAPAAVGDVPPLGADR
jgi:drug/metabolite transporter (DMT)-like permease